MMVDKKGDIKYGQGEQTSRPQASSLSLFTPLSLAPIGTPQPSLPSPHPLAMPLCHAPSCSVETPAWDVPVPLQELGLWAQECLVNCREPRCKILAGQQVLTAHH